MFDPTEFVKCREDFAYFAKKYLKVIHPKRGLIPFDLHSYQKKLVKAYDSERFVIVKKFRQSGITTLTIMWLLWKCMFFTDQNIFVGVKSDREAIHSAKLIDKTIQELPHWLKTNLVHNTAYEKEFDTGSHIIFSSFEPCCGKALTHLVVDEAAFIKNVDEHWKAFYPAISTGGHAIVMSTNNGANWFSETYNDAEDGINKFHAVQIHFWEHADYNNPDWVKMIKENLGIIGWTKEVLCEDDYEQLPKEITDKAKELTNWELAQRVRSVASKLRKDKEFRAYLLEAYERLEKQSI